MELNVLNCKNHPTKTSEDKRVVEGGREEFLAERVTN